MRLTTISMITIFLVISFNVIFSQENTIVFEGVAGASGISYEPWEYKYKMTLDYSSGKIEGIIEWKFIRADNYYSPSLSWAKGKKRKTSIEYVRGTYEKKDSRYGTEIEIFMRGYAEDDEYDIKKLWTYDMTFKYSETYPEKNRYPLKSRVFLPKVDYRQERGWENTWIHNGELIEGSFWDMYHYEPPVEYTSDYSNEPEQNVESTDLTDWLVIIGGGILVLKGGEFIVKELFSSDSGSEANYQSYEPSSQTENSSDIKSSNDSDCEIEVSEWKQASLADIRYEEVKSISCYESSFLDKAEILRAKDLDDPFPYWVCITIGGFTSSDSFKTIEEAIIHAVNGMKVVCKCE